MHRITLIFVIVIALSLMLAACGGSESSPAGDGSGAVSAAQGEELYKGTVIGAASAPGCITCHSLDEGVTLVGPSHYQMGARAGSVVPGKSAEVYLRESIVEPDAHVVEGFAPGVMYQNYGNDLTEQEIDSLVAFLMSLQ